MGHDFELWLYCEKGIAEVRNLHISAELAKAEKYRAEHGRFPTKAEYDLIEGDIPDVDWELISKYDNVYYREFEFSYKPYLYGTTALVSQEDYVKISKSYGETDSYFENAKAYFNF